MSLGKLNSVLLIAVMALAAASCSDKDDETETPPSLSGLYFDCPFYVAPFQSVDITPRGVKHPEGGEVGYSWRISPGKNKADTLSVFTHQFKDTLQKYTITCYAFAEGYSGDSYSREVLVVKGGLDGSITETGIAPSDSKVTVDGTDYYYEKIGGLEWFRNNLASSGSGAPYMNEEVTSDVFGRFYSYEEALDACPEGWRLPTEEDWMSLADAMGEEVSQKYAIFENVASKLLVNASFNDISILEYWPQVGVVTNESRLSLLPFGYANLGDKDADGNYPAASFGGIFDYAAFWTADRVEDDEEMAYYRYIIADQPEMLVGKGDADTFGASVRCVRDAQ